MKKFNCLFAFLALAFVVVLYCHSVSSKNNVSLLSENVEALAGYEGQNSYNPYEVDCHNKGWNYNEALRHETTTYIAGGKEIEVNVGAGWKGINGNLGGKIKEPDKVVIQSTYDCKPSTGNCCDPSAQKTHIVIE